MTIKGSGAKSLPQKHFFSLKKEEGTKHSCGLRRDSALSGDALYGRVAQCGMLLAVQHRNECITNAANFKQKTLGFVIIKHF